MDINQVSELTGSAYKARREQNSRESRMLARIAAEQAVMRRNTDIERALKLQDDLAQAAGDLAVTAEVEALVPNE